MVDLPEGWPMFCNDLKQEMKRLGLSKSELPKQTKNLHDALADAEWIKLAHEFILNWWSIK